jgi:hypothetical protein
MRRRRVRSSEGPWRMRSASSIPTISIRRDVLETERVAGRLARRPFRHGRRPQTRVALDFRSHGLEDPFGTHRRASVIVSLPMNLPRLHSEDNCRRVAVAGAAYGWREVWHGV